MNRILPRLFAIGADPRDDADLRLRKVLVLTAMMMIMPAALLWGAQVVTGLHTTERLGDAVDFEWLDEVQGRTDPVRPCILRPAAH